MDGEQSITGIENSLGHPVSSDSSFIAKVQKLYVDHGVVLLDRTDGRIEFEDESKNRPIPSEFSIVSIRGRGLKVKVLHDNSEEVNWEIHFGINGLNNRAVAAAEGISIFDTFSAMVSDLAKLKDLLAKSPQIRPDLIIGGPTNKTMLDFLNRLDANLIKELVPVPDLYIGDGTDKTEAYLTIFDKDKFLGLLERTDSRLTPRENTRNLLNKSR